jgi:NCS2 family nucleobase:cation symporter-2
MSELSKARIPDAPAIQRLPLLQLILVGLQHVLLMYGGAIAVPLIIGQAAGLSREEIAFLINADLLVAGIATIVQSLGIGPVGIRMPVMMGASFAAVGSMVAMAGMPGVGLQGIFGATIAAGFFGMLIAPFMSKVVRFFPPLVTGTVITSIGLSLFPVAVNWAGGGAAQFGSPIYLTIAALVLATILLINRFMRGFWVNVSVLIGMCLGYMLCGAIGMVDLSGMAKAPWCSSSPRCTSACRNSNWRRSCRCAWWW